MAKKSSKNPTKPTVADGSAKRPATTYPGDKVIPSSPPVGPSVTPTRGTEPVKPPAAPNPAEAQSRLPKSAEKIVVVEKTPAATVPKAVNVPFVLLDPDARQVSLCGDFNNWSSGATYMRRHSGGHWETTIPLAPGRYEYKFWVDGQWIPDPMASENVWNQHGTLNSVIEVRL